MANFYLQFQKPCKVGKLETHQAGKQETTIFKKPTPSKTHDENTRGRHKSKMHVENVRRKRSGQRNFRVE